uniref:Zasp-like motif domain-containing protein n=1 Tax=Anopheles atroparvus TaxID=41427 RepID=A0AAG5D8S2_ANOAO
CKIINEGYWSKRQLYFTFSTYPPKPKIDFDDPSTTKPPSLAKSAVLAALEEEEREKSRGTGLKRVAWPPPAEGSEYEVHPSQQQHAVGQQIPVQQQYQPPQHQQPQQQYHQTAPHQQQQQQPHPTYQQTNFQQQHPHQPVERIIPIQRATSVQSPLATPTKSPVNQLKYPTYPAAGSASPGSPHYAAGPPPNSRGSCTVSFSGGRAVQPSKAQHYHPQQQPAYGAQAQRSGGYGSPAPRSPGIPVASPRSPGSTLSASPRGWAHVASPVPVHRPSPQAPFSSSSSPFYHQQQQQQQQPQQYHQGYVPSAQTGQAPQAAWYGARKPEDQQHYQQPLAPQYQNPLQQQPYQPQPTEAFQPLTSQQPLYQTTVQPQQQQQQLPPTLVTTLRKEPPMSQEPAPVYQTQPVAAIYQGGSNMRGDQKWPPEEYKRQSEVDNEERRKLAQQPAFRPRRQQKDYGAFFAKNALNNTYPGYRAPPGTQHHG